MAPVPISRPIAVILQAELVSESLHWLFPLPVPSPDSSPHLLQVSALFKAAPTAFPLPLFSALFTFHKLVLSVL